ncbi:MAG: hypothetical protein JW797_04930 [Bradymonadales bacterium]|nr:hypothetical protein [Bradymonadales bacterium]
MRQLSPAQPAGRSLQAAGRWILVCLAALLLFVFTSGCTLFFDADPGRAPAQTTGDTGTPDAGGE